MLKGKLRTVGRGILACHAVEGPNWRHFFAIQGVWSDRTPRPPPAAHLHLGHCQAIVGVFGDVELEGHGGMYAYSYGFKVTR